MGWLIPLFSGVISLAKGWFATKRAEQQTKIALHSELQTQGVVNTISDTSLRALQLWAFKSNFLFKDITFIGLVILYVWAAFAPLDVKHVFDNICMAIPASIQYITAATYFTIWGLGKLNQIKGLRS